MQQVDGEGEPGVVPVVLHFYFEQIAAWFEGHITCAFAFFALV